VEEVSASNRSDLPLRKETRHGDGAQSICNGARIMVGFAEQALTATTATEHEGPDGSTAVSGPIGCQKQVQVFARRQGITEVKLDRLPLLHDIPDGHRTCRLIGADQVTDEKVTALKSVPVFIDHDTDVQCPVGPLTGFPR
jgi:hypothetical protein